MKKTERRTRVVYTTYQLNPTMLQRAVIQFASEGAYMNESEGGTWEGDVDYDDDGHLMYRLIHTVETPEPGVHDVDDFYMDDDDAPPPTP